MKYGPNLPALISPGPSTLGAMAEEAARRGPLQTDRVRRPVTITDVARAAGVSKATVSYALNGRPGVSDDTRALVLRLADELGWTPSLRARSISLSRAHALGLVIERPAESMGDPFISRSMAGIQEVLEPLRRVLVVAMASGEEAELETYRSLANDGRVDGFFLIDVREDDPRLPLLEELGLPAVTLGPADATGDLVVGSDTEAALTEAIRMLIDLGHTRFACVTGPARLMHTPHRIEVIARTLREAGLPHPLVELGDYSAASGGECMRRLLAHSDRPTAIIYANDVMAIGGMNMAGRLGYRLPAELSVVGMGDIELAAYVTPALTSIQSDAWAIGAEAARRLLARVEPDFTSVPVAIPEPTLVRRASVGPAPEHT